MWLHTPLALYYRLALQDNQYKQFQAELMMPTCRFYRHLVLQIYYYVYYFILLL
jgi:hypothetical protein